MRVRYIVAALVGLAVVVGLLFSAPRAKTWAIKLKNADDATVERLAREHGAKVVRRFHADDNIVFFEGGSWEPAVNAGHAEWAEEQVARARFTRSVISAAESVASRAFRNGFFAKETLPPTLPSERWLRAQAERAEHDRMENGQRARSVSTGTDYAEPRVWARDMPSMHDPLFGSQWHLNMSYVTAAWSALGALVYGQGVRIAVVDDGLQHSVADIAANYAPGSSWDINDDDPDPAPSWSAHHGTQAAGVAAAAINTECGVGAAPEAEVAGIRLIAAPATDHDEATGLGYMIQDNDILSCSWGPMDDGRHLEGPGRLTKMAFEHAVVRGRGGLGTIYVWAAGNGAHNGDRCDYDGYASSRFTIAIGAVGRNGMAPWYSEPGAAVLAVAPSSDGVDSITTCDTRGCSNSFGGTSAAAPLAAGIIALALQVRPALTWRDVQGLIVNTSVVTDPSDATWVTNGAGLRVSEQYGFGMLHAEQMVRRALTWQSLGPQHSEAVYGPTESGSGTIVLQTTIGSAVSRVEHVEVVLSMVCANRGHWTIDLSSPMGTLIKFAEQRGDYSGQCYQAWTFTTAHLWGENPLGTWTLRVRNSARSGETAEITSWRLNVYGT